ncbi:hypothetical protein OAB11_03100, partial [Verrucomicrobia bacterium]|nr:hypothetical protein [Verrucomicrobiota bacterium]
ISRWAKSSGKKAIAKWQGEDLHHQNYLRQAFEAHAYVKFSYDLRTLAEVSGNSEETIKQSYNGIVDPEDNATHYFNLYPREVFTEGIPLAKELKIVGDKELGKHEKNNWFCAAKVGKAETIFKVWTPNFSEDDMVSVTLPSTDEEWENVHGDGFFQTTVRTINDIIELGDSYQEKIVKLFAFKTTYHFDPTDQTTFNDIRTTKLYLEANLGKDIWNYRLTLDEKGVCPHV